MQFRNTPMQDCRRSPAQIVYGRQLRDFLPAIHNKLEPLKDWAVTQEHRERMLAKSRELDGRRWNRHTKNHSVLDVGTPVAIQNQTGKNPTKWDKTGVILENNPYSQVKVRVDGSRRITCRNRRFIKPLYKDLKPQQMNTVSEIDDTAGDFVTENVMDPCANSEDSDTPAIEQGNIENAINTPDVICHSDTASTDCSDQSSHPVVVQDLPSPSNVVDRPRRVVKPNSKYDSETYDLSY